jgi:hypothetical protein
MIGAVQPVKKMETTEMTCWEDDFVDSYTLFDSVDSCTPLSD